MKLGVPLYVHPAVDPQSWQSVEAHAGEIDWLVVNAADGPGSMPDGVLGSALSRIREAGINVLGYVDAGYGRRTVADLREDQRRWRSWYDVAGTFLDQVPGDQDQWVQEAVGGLRASGATQVVGNPGVALVAPSGAWFDSVVAFEGTADQHRAVCGGSADRPETRRDTCHLVYGVPRGQMAEAVARAHTAGASVIWVTGGMAPNPYDGVPEYFEDLIDSARSIAGEPGAVGWRELDQQDRT